MKKFGIFACSLILISSMMVAQDQPNDNRSKKERIQYSPETMAMMRADRLDQQVGLTSKEKEAVIALFKKEETEALARREACQKEQEKRIEEMKAQKAQSNENLKKIIGDEKFAKYKEAKDGNDKNRPLADPRECERDQQFPRPEKRK